MVDTAPDRWLRLRQPSGFPVAAIHTFRASVDVFTSHVEALLRNWEVLHPRSGSAPKYVFFPVEVSEDLTVLSLPIGGTKTLGSCAAIENGRSYLLWQHMPSKVMEGLEEGLTEVVDGRVGPETKWRTPASSIGFLNADPEHRRRLADMAPN